MVAFASESKSRSVAHLFISCLLGMLVLCVATVNAAPAPAQATSMTWQGWFCLAVVLLVIIGLYFDLVSCTAMMYTTTLILTLATIIDSKQYVAGLSNLGVVTIAHLFIVVDPISKLPAVKRVVTNILEYGSWHGNVYFVRLKLCVLAMVLSPFTNQNPLVVMLTPIVKGYCRDKEIAPAQLLMPMAAASAFGGSWSVIGTSVNLVYDGLMVNANMGHMPFFELFKTAIVPSLLGLIYLVFVPSLVLSSDTGNLFKLVWKQSSAFLAQFSVKATSSLIGMQVGHFKETLPAELRQEVDLIELNREAGDAIVHAPPRPNDVFEADDLLVFSGPIATLMSYAKILHLEWVPHEENEPTFGSANADTQAAFTNPAPLPTETVTSPFVADGKSPFVENVVPPAAAAEEKEMLPTPQEDATLAPPPRAGRRATGLGMRLGLAEKKYKTGDDTSPMAVVPAASPNHAFSSTPAAGHRTAHPEFLEVILDFRSQAIGTTVGSALFRRRYNATILAVRPVEGHNVVSTSQMLHHHILKQGDTLLVYGDPSFLSTFATEFSLVLQNKKEEAQSSKDIAKSYIVVPDWFPFGTTVGKSDLMDAAAEGGGGHGSGPAVSAGMKLIRLPEHHQYLSLVIFIGMVAFTIAGFEIFITSAIAVVLFVALKLMTVHDAVHAVDFNVMIQIAYSFGLGSGMSSSSLAGVIGNGLSSANVSGFKFHLLIAAIASVVTNAITNKACAQVLFPIVISVQRAANRDPLPAVMVLCAVSSWAFSTSYGKPSNLIVMGPGGYTGKDYAKLGILLNLIMVPIVAASASVVYGQW